MSAKIYRSKTLLDNGKDYARFVNVPSLNWLAKLEIETVGGTLKNTSHFDTGRANHGLNIGYEFYDTENNKTDAKTAVYSQGESGRLHSLYVEDKIAIGNFSLTPGMRYDHYTLENPSTGEKTYDRFSKGTSQKTENKVR